MAETKRSPYDFYPTPRSAFEAFFEADKENWKDVKYVFEPCAGDGALITYMKDSLSNVWYSANELDESHKETLTAVVGDDGNVTWGDYFDIYVPDDQEFDVVITNPPFSMAQEILQHTFKNVGGRRIIMLLRLNFLASQKRRAFWQEYPPNRIYVLSKRPSFTGTGTDSQDYAWFVWDGVKYDQQIVVV